MTTGPGDFLPALTLTATDGRAVSLADLRGQATLIIFLRHLA